MVVLNAVPLVVDVHVADNLVCTDSGPKLDELFAYCTVSGVSCINGSCDRPALPLFGFCC